MKLLRELSPQLALAGIVALQISCGDSSGPGGNAAASIAALTTTALHGAPGAPVDEPPSVIVRDANGNPVSGSKFIEVHFRNGKVVNMGDQFGLGRAHLKVSAR